MSDRAGGASFTQAMTRAENLSVECTADNRISFGVDRPGNTKRAATGQAAYDATFNFLRNRYKNSGGVACSVSATATPFRMPASLVDTGPGALSQTQLRTRGAFTLCGAGRLSGNTCCGELLVLTGDWGFDGPMGSPINGDVKSFQDNEIVNDPCAGFVKRLYEENGDSQGSAGRKMLRVVAGVVSGQPEYLDESQFNMSFLGDRGTRDVVQVDRFVVDEPQLRYQTSGADMRSNYVN